jgi:pimeloyl-ACP methyl ester carboxylesterase
VEASSAVLVAQLHGTSIVTAWLESMGDVDKHPNLASIRAPCLVAHRRGDVIVPVANGRALAEAIPGAEYVELPGSDHLWWTRGQDSSRPVGRGASHASTEPVEATPALCGERRDTRASRRANRDVPIRMARR